MKFLSTCVFLLVPFLLIECASFNYKNYLPYSQLPPHKVKKLVPIKYEDCINAFDTILSPLVKQHFRNQDNSVAVIEICDDIGGFFTTNWRFYRYNKAYHWPDEIPTELPDKPTNVVSKFIYDGVVHPKAMLRVMFTCYYKYLNGQEYNWENEINRIKQLWPNMSPTNYDVDLPDTVSKLESKKISAYYFNLLNINDTVNILYNRKPLMTKKSSDWYYLTGIINFKIPESESINIRIVSIESEFNQNFMLTGDDTLHNGDTITNYHKGWLSRNWSYFNYHKVVEQRAAFNLN